LAGWLGAVSSRWSYAGRQSGSSSTVLFCVLQVVFYNLADLMRGVNLHIDNSSQLAGKAKAKQTFRNEMYHSLINKSKKAA